MRTGVVLLLAVGTLLGQAVNASAPRAGSPGIAWRPDVVGVAIPHSGAAGRIHGTAFAPNGAEIENGFLNIHQRHGWETLREFTIVLDLKRGEKPDDRTYLVRFDSQRGPAVPHILMSWKVNPRLRTTRCLVQGYAMRLQLGHTVNGKLPGRVYLCMDDPEHSFVAGTFVARVKP